MRKYQENSFVGYLSVDGKKLGFESLDYVDAGEFFTGASKYLRVMKNPSLLHFEYVGDSGKYIITCADGRGRGLYLGMSSTGYIKGYESRGDNKHYILSYENGDVMGLADLPKPVTNWLTVRCSRGHLGWRDNECLGVDGKTSIGYLFTLQITERDVAKE